MFDTIAYAQDAAAPAGGAFGMMIPLIAFFAIFYFLLIRPQQKRQKQLQNTINALRAGDTIVTTSGFIGTIDSVIDSNTFMINLGNTKVRILKAGISGTYAEGDKTDNTLIEKK
ncbi:MAG: preprotein translocase subunit YajC [Deferribacteraceae bacterium]|jgi:preprotein translocase subunit YajC|nr:preprotein translocase subunit YajC [Deferribacteraceae bacterium]